MNHCAGCKIAYPCPVSPAVGTIFNFKVKLFIDFLKISEYVLNTKISIRHFKTALPETFDLTLQSGINVTLSLVMFYLNCSFIWPWSKFCHDTAIHNFISNKTCLGHIFTLNCFFAQYFLHFVFWFTKSHLFSATSSS